MDPFVLTSPSNNYCLWGVRCLSRLGVLSRHCLVLSVSIRVYRLSIVSSVVLIFAVRVIVCLLLDPISELPSSNQMLPAASVRASLCAHFHFRLRCIEIQSSSFKFFIFCSASCVHRLIHSDHGSMLVTSLSSTCLGGVGDVDVVLFVSSSLSVDGSGFV